MKTVQVASLKQDVDFGPPNEDKDEEVTAGLFGGVPESLSMYGGIIVTQMMQDMIWGALILLIPKMFGFLKRIFGRKVRVEKQANSKEIWVTKSKKEAFDEDPEVRIEHDNLTNWRRYDWEEMDNGGPLPKAAKHGIILHGKTSNVISSGRKAKKKTKKKSKNRQLGLLFKTADGILNNVGSFSKFKLRKNPKMYLGASPKVKNKIIIA